MRFTDLVNEHYADLNETELLMCNYIMENIDIIPTMSTLEFARNSLSSKSSVIRFSQKLGFTGFTELRNFIKWQDHEERFDEQITFTNQVIKDIERLLNILKDRNWLPIYQIIDSVDNIYVITTGITQKNQAAELQRLFLLIGKPLQIIPGNGNSNEFRRILERLTEKDIVFVLSLSGENNRLESIIHQLELVKSKIVSITSLQNNWLSGKSDFNLYATTSRSPLPKDWWLQTASSFFVLIEAFAFGYDDPAVPAKAVFNLAKEKAKAKLDVFKIKGGYLTGKKVSVKEVEELAKLPSREQLLSMLLNSMLGPIRKLAYATVAIADKKEGSAE